MKCALAYIFLENAFANKYAFICDGPLLQNQFDRSLFGKGRLPKTIPFRRNLTRSNGMSEDTVGQRSILLK